MYESEKGVDLFNGNATPYIPVRLSEGGTE